MPWMAESLIERYARLEFQFEEEPFDNSQAVNEEEMDEKLAQGEIQGIAVPYAELFLLVATRKILQAQAARSDEEIAADTSGTSQQGLAHQAQKEAYVYVTELFADRTKE